MNFIRTEYRESILTQNSQSTCPKGINNVFKITQRQIKKILFWRLKILKKRISTARDLFSRVH